MYRVWDFWWDTALPQDLWVCGRGVGAGVGWGRGSTLYKLFLMYRIVTEGEVTTANSTRGR